MGRAKLNSLFSLLGVGTLFILVHWASWYYLEFEFDAQKVLAETTTGGAIGVLYGLLPSLNKRYLQLKARRILASFYFLVSIFALCASVSIFSVILCRSEIRWPSGQGEIELDGRKVASSSWTETNKHSTSVFGSFFRKSDLVVGDYSEVVHYRPFVPLVYEIPESAIFSSRPDYQQIVTLLALSFFQSTENRFLSDAKEKFSSEESKQFIDLNTIYQILKLCFIENDLARSGDKLLSTFQKQSAKSPWLPLLRSCQHYSRGEFAMASLDLQTVPENVHSPLLDASAFFRGVNLLKAFIELSNSEGKREIALLQKSREAFERTEALSRLSNDIYFSQISLRSAQIFEGITFVYEHDNDKAFDRFKEAAKSDYRELRSRALSDLGYVSLLLGDLDGAESYFVKALEADRKFPYAQTNLGYTYLAQGRYDAARDVFSKLVNDDYLKRFSARDVILSELALAHIEAENSSTDIPNPDAYAVPLKEMGIFDYQGMSPPMLRLSKIRLALADRIYMSHDYYGLEMFALAMYARAYFEAKSVGDQPALQIAATALTAFKTVASTIDARCFVFHVDHGFFKPVADLTKLAN